MTRLNTNTQYSSINSFEVADKAHNPDFSDETHKLLNSKCLSFKAKKNTHQGETASPQTTAFKYEEWHTDWSTKNTFQEFYCYSPVSSRDIIVKEVNLNQWYGVKNEIQQILKAKYLKTIQ